MTTLILHSHEFGLKEDWHRILETLGFPEWDWEFIFEVRIEANDWCKVEPK